jgi:hypothetical protein
MLNRVKNTPTLFNLKEESQEIIFIIIIMDNFHE